MAMTPGLSPSIRELGPEPAEEHEPSEVIVEMAPEGEDVPEIDRKGNILRIEHGDGSITVSLDGTPIDKAKQSDDGGWFENLVDQIEQQELYRISEDLLRGISDDIESRNEWIMDRANGIKLLGLKIEIPGLQGASDGAPVEGMSKVRHPLLLEAVLRFQANARSEMLPTDGPVKIRDDSRDGLPADQLADALEEDLNHYLTAVATEYYPDTDRMFFMLGFGGSSFKKIYNCPLRNRPVSETVDADDLIVNQSATDLQNAKRITHRAYLKPSTVKRLQILGVYRDIDLSTPKMVTMDAQQREEKAQQGISVSVTNPDDRDREIYECYCELDIKGFEHEMKGEETGLEIPYRVTIDVSTREILSIVRNYDEDDKELPTAKARFVKYTFVPGLGFYDIGLLHILGNTTNAITAAWRELLDAGMYSNFPGFLMADTGGRQNTNIFRIPPGGGALVKTGGLPISQAIMPLPYQPPSQALMQLVSDMADTGMRIGGTAEQQVGEGNAEAPVGTTLAMIEQAEKVMNSVHKRMHASQAHEFKLLVECFKENPDSFWRKKCKSKTQWDREQFLRAVNNCDLVPQADPNTASHGQRVMKIMALKQLQQSNPSMYDPIAIDTAALQAIGWNNPQQFMAPPEAQKAPPPEMQQMQAKMANEKAEADARVMEAKAKVAEIQAKIQQGAFAPKPQTAAGAPQVDQAQQQAALMTAKARLMDAQTKAQNAEVDHADTMAQIQQRDKDLTLKHHDLMVEDQNRNMDRQSKEKIQAIELARDILIHNSDQSHEAKQAHHDRQAQSADRKAAAKSREAPKKKDD